METNPAGEVTRIFSDAFEQPGEGAVLIDKGSGDVYVHAQSHYLAKDIRDEYGRANYRWTGEALEEIPEEEPAPDEDEEMIPDDEEIIPEDETDLIPEEIPSEDEIVIG